MRRLFKAARLFQVKNGGRYDELAGPKVAVAARITARSKGCKTDLKQGSPSCIETASQISEALDDY